MPSVALYTLTIRCRVALTGPTPAATDVAFSVRPARLAARADEVKSVTVGWGEGKYRTRKERVLFYVTHDIQQITTSKEVVSINIGVNSACSQGTNNREFSHSEFRRDGAEATKFVSLVFLDWIVDQGKKITCTVNGVGGFVKLLNDTRNQLYPVEFAAKTSYTYTP